MSEFERVLELAVGKIVNEISASEYGDYITICFTDGTQLEIMAHCNLASLDGEISAEWNGKEIETLLKKKEYDDTSKT